MDKVFRVELSGNKDRCCELELPATYYSLLDALDKLQMAPGDKPRWEFLEHHSFPFLHVHLAHECDLYQLNALATVLGQMNSRERTAFEGLFNMEVAKKYGPISVATMIDLAYSADCCHVVNATTDEQLGRWNFFEFVFSTYSVVPLPSAEPVAPSRTLRRAGAFACGVGRASAPDTSGRGWHPPRASITRAVVDDHARLHVVAEDVEGHALAAIFHGLRHHVHAAGHQLASLEDGHHGHEYVVACGIHIVATAFSKAACPGR